MLPAQLFNRFDMSKDRDLKTLLEFDKTATEHVSTYITRFLGSMPFLVSYLLILAGWLCWNSGVFPAKPFANILSRCWKCAFRYLP